MKAYAGVTIHLDGRHIEVDATFDLGKDRPDSPMDMALKDVMHEGASIVDQLTKPEQDFVIDQGFAKLYGRPNG